MELNDYLNRPIEDPYTPSQLRHRRMQEKRKSPVRSVLVGAVAAVGFFGSAAVVGKIYNDRAERAHEITMQQQKPIVDAVQKQLEQKEADKQRQVAEDPNLSDSSNLQP